MSHLLVVARLKSKAMQRKSNVPLMLEYKVAPETAPYLVTSSSSVMWINEPHPGDIVKAAVRQMSISEFFTEVVEAVAAMGRQQKWGNVHPLTVEGLRAAVEHIEFYELGPVELLTPRAHQPGEATEETDLVNETDPDDDEGEVADVKKRVEAVDLMPPELRPFIEELGLPFRPSSWVPEGTIVVVPKDRTFVGVVNRVTTKKLAGVVHNAARGIALAQGTPPDELAGDALQDPDAG